MMKRFRTGLFCGALVPLGGVLWLFQRSPDLPSSRLEMNSWSPTPAEIQRQVKALDTHPPEQTLEEARFLLFRQLFKKRYRDHGLSINAFGPTPQKLILLTPAQELPWTINLVALSLREEIRTNFGRETEIDIYATYIASSKRFIGKLRPSPKDPHTALVTFFPDVRR